MDHRLTEDQVRAVLEAAMEVGQLPTWLAKVDGSSLNEEGLADVVELLYDMGLMEGS